MRVVAFNGSPHKKGNTYIMLRRCLDTIENEGISSELINLGTSDIKPCMGCDACRKAGDERCVINDPLNDWFAKIVESDGLLLGSPCYFWNMHPTMKCFIDRVGYLARGKLRKGEGNNVLRHKVGAALAVDGYTGAPMTVQQMQVLFMTTQMIVPGACYWPVGKGVKPGDVENDKGGLSYAEDLGREMAWLIKKINA